MLFKTYDEEPQRKDSDHKIEEFKQMKKDLLCFKKDEVQSFKHLFSKFFIFKMEYFLFLIHFQMEKKNNDVDFLKFQLNFQWYFDLVVIEKRK